MSDDRIADLETRLMYQEQTIEELNSIVTRQNLELSRIVSKIGKLQGDIEQLQPLLGNKQIDEGPPPHY